MVAGRVHSFVNPSRHDCPDGIVQKSSFGVRNVKLCPPTIRKKSLELTCKCRFAFLDVVIM